MRGRKGSSYHERQSAHEMPSSGNGKERKLTVRTEHGPINQNRDETEKKRGDLPLRYRGKKPARIFSVTDS